MQYNVASFHKCASNWTRRLFRDLADRNGMDIWVDLPNSAEINQCVERGSADVMCIFRNGRRDSFLKHANAGAPVVLCVRDPKDVLVSQYFSWKSTHVRNNDRIRDFRAQLEKSGLREGLMLLIDQDQIPFCGNVRQWPSPDQDKAIHLLRFEELLDGFDVALRRAAEHLNIDLDAEYCADLEERYSFQTITKRTPGEEERTSHYRKGVKGDWVNYFDEGLAEAFDARFGAVCDQLGYSRACDALAQSG